MRVVLRTKELCELFGLNYLTVLRWLKTGKLQAKKVGRDYLIPISTVSDLFGVDMADILRALEQLDSQKPRVQKPRIGQKTLEFGR